MPPLLIDEPLERVPLPYRAAADGSQPLAPGVEFIRQDGHVSLGATWAVAATLGAFGTVMLTSLPFDVSGTLRTGSPNGWQLILWSVLLILGAALPAIAIRMVRAERALDAECRRADFRYGLFLFPDALLIRLYNQGHTLVPRSRIERAAIQNHVQGGQSIVLHLRTGERVVVPGSLGNLNSARSRITA